MKLKIKKFMAIFLVALLAVSGNGVVYAGNGNGNIPSFLSGCRELLAGKTGEPEDSSERILISTEDVSDIRQKDQVIGNYKNLYLISCESEKEAEKTCRYYRRQGVEVQQDVRVYAAGINHEFSENPNQKQAEEDNPLDALQDILEKEESQEKQDLHVPLIALIDTGVEGTGITNAVSVIDGKKSGGTHGEKMKEKIFSQNRNAQILSIRALDDQGYGTVSSIVAAIEYAISAGADIINLSLYAENTAESSVLLSELEKASDRGIVVVGAAGNAGEDAAGFLPGASEKAYIIGSCNRRGERLWNSNFGKSVDYYVEAESTSEAAALFTGFVSCNGTDRIGDFSLLAENVKNSENAGNLNTDDRNLSIDHSKKVTVTYTFADENERELNIENAFSKDRCEDRNVHFMKTDLPVYRRTDGSYLIFADAVISNGTADGEILDYEFTDDETGDKIPNMVLDKKTGIAEMKKAGFASDSVSLKILVPIRDNDTDAVIPIETKDTKGNVIRRVKLSYSYQYTPVFVLDKDLKLEQFRIYLNGERTPLSEKQYSYNNVTGEVRLDTWAAVVSGICIQADTVLASKFMSALNEKENGSIQVVREDNYNYKKAGLGNNGNKSTFKYSVNYQGGSYDAYCVQPSNSTPPSGTYDIARAEDSGLLARILYYGNDVVKKYWPKFDDSQTWILVHLAAGYVYCSYSGGVMGEFDWDHPASAANKNRELPDFEWGGVYDSVKEKVLRLIGYCREEYDSLPDGTVEFHNENGKKMENSDSDGNVILQVLSAGSANTDSENGMQRTEKVQLYADKSQSFEIAIPKGMGCRNETSGETISTENNGRMVIHGGDQFYFIADRSFTGTWSSGTLTGSKKAIQAQVYKIYTGKSDQNLAFICTEEKKPKIRLKINWKGITEEPENTLTILKTDAEKHDTEKENGSYFMTLDSAAGTQRLKGASFAVLYVGEYEYRTYNSTKDYTVVKKHFTPEQMKTLQSGGIVRQVQIAEGINTAYMDVSLKNDSLQYIITEDQGKIAWDNVISGSRQTLVTGDNGVTESISGLKNGTVLVYEIRSPKGYLLEGTKESGHQIGGSIEGKGGEIKTVSVSFTGKNGQKYQTSAIYTSLTGNAAAQVKIRSYDYLPRGDFQLKKTNGYGQGIRARYRIENKQTGTFYEFETKADGSYSSKEDGEKLYRIFSEMSDGTENGSDAYQNTERSQGSLPYGTYQITELSTENGVQLLKQPITITIPLSMTESERKKAKAENRLDDSDVIVDSENEIVYYPDQSISIQNDRVTTIPDAGGKEPYWLIIVGTGAAIVGIFLTRYREKIEK